MPTPPDPFPIPADLSGQTLAAILRQRMPDQSWTQVRKLIAARRINIDDALCLDPARRLKEGEVLEVLARAAPVHRGATVDGLVLRHLDDDVVVVEKASGVNTVRHPVERDWNERRRELSPTLEDLTQRAIAERLGKPKHRLPTLRIVQRLDKDTSGLVVFARSIPAERGLGKQFHAHTVLRRYLAIVRGYLIPQTFSSWLVQDRGDGRRGSGPEGQGKIAVTHVDVLERLPKHTLLLCQLETGRTHQIRIHLSEAGYPVCGEKVYNRRPGGEPIPDEDETPRLALHAAELGFEHPVTHEHVQWEMELPLDLQGFIARLRPGFQAIGFNMPYTPVLATLGYVISPNGEDVLLIHRNRNPADHHFGKYNGLGGKLEPGEDIVAGMKREIREEANIECEKLSLRGTVSWPGFGKHGQDWFGFIFRIDAHSGEPCAGNDEGSLVWMPRQNIVDLPLWEGDLYFLPLVFDPRISQFHGVMPYRDGRPVSWNVSCL